LYYSPDGGQTLVPVQFEEPSEPNGNDEPAVRSNLVASNHPGMPANEPQLEASDEGSLGPSDISYECSEQGTESSAAELYGTHAGEGHDSKDPPQQAASPAKWGRDVLVGQKWKVLCSICNTVFYSRKAFNRHFDDKHSDPKKCPECDLMIVGKRKLKAHFDRAHKDVL